MEDYICLYRRYGEIRWMVLTATSFEEAVTKTLKSHLDSTDTLISVSKMDDAILSFGNGIHLTFPRKP